MNNKQSYLLDLWDQYKGPLTRAEFVALELNSLMQYLPIENEVVQEIFDEIEKYFTDEELKYMNDFLMEIKGSRRTSVDLLVGPIYTDERRSKR